MKSLICLLLCLGSAFAQDQSVSQSSKALATPKTIQKPDFTISNADARGTGVIVCSGNGQLLAAGWRDTVRIYDVQSGGGKSLKPIQRLSAPSAVLALTFRDANTLVTLLGDQSVKTWDVASGKILSDTVLNIGKPIIPAFAPGNQPLLAEGALRQVRLWNFQSGQLVQTVEVNDSNVSALAFTPDGKLLVIGTIKGVIRVMNVAALKVTGTVDLDSPVRALSASAKCVLVAYTDGTLARLDFGDAKSVPEVQGNNDATGAIAFSPAGDRFASASESGTIRVWDSETLKQICAFKGDGGGVGSIVFSPNGLNLISSSVDGIIDGWRLPPST